MTLIISCELDRDNKNFASASCYGEFNFYLTTKGKSESHVETGVTDPIEEGTYVIQEFVCTAGLSPPMN